MKIRNITLGVILMLSTFKSTAQTKTNNFLVALEVIGTNATLKSILSDGNSFKVTEISKPYPVIQVIPPFIYLHNQQKNILSIYTAKGDLAFTQINCTKFSANQNGLVVINPNNDAQVFTIYDGNIKQSGAPLPNISNAKISDSVMLVYTSQNKSIEVYRLSPSRNTYFTLQTYGWNQQNNIVGISLNNSFLISKDALTITKVINNQGNTIYEGRGNLKSLDLTNNHFLAYYGSGRVEAYNAFDKQNILSLSKVYDLQSSLSFTSFHWDQEITILNEKGEIFPVKLLRNSHFAQGDNFFATFEQNGNLSIYTSSGDLIANKQYAADSDIVFYADFLCVARESDDLNCHYAADANFQAININKNGLRKILGWQNAGLATLENDDLKTLNIYFYSGKSFHYNNIKDIYLPVSIDANERDFINF